jgi:hypothetical protein
LVTICEAAEAAMKAASGEMDSGGDIKLCAMTDGRSLEILWVLDRREGEASPEEAGRDIAGSCTGFILVFWIPYARCSPPVLRGRSLPPSSFSGTDNDPNNDG